MERVFSVHVTNEEITDKEAEKIAKTLQKSLMKYFKKGYEIRVDF